MTTPVQFDLVPQFPPRWAEVFGEDRHGIFAEFRIRKVAFVWRWIPRGRFQMGSPELEPGRNSDEGPQDWVVLTRGFWMGETPVTQSQWEVVMGTNPSHFKGADRPVERVSWIEAATYCKKLFHEVPGFEVQLPTEAQWEYACRAGSVGAFCDGSPCSDPVGEDPALNRLGWYSENSDGKTQPVRQKRPNGWGLYDVHGNVWEWVRDGRRTYTGETVSDPVGPEEDGALRVFRGGSWLNTARFCRAAFRDRGVPDCRNPNLGFRLSAGQEIEAAEPPGAERP